MEQFAINAGLTRRPIDISTEAALNAVRILENIKLQGDAEQKDRNEFKAILVRIGADPAAIVQLLRLGLP